MKTEAKWDQLQKKLHAMKRQSEGMFKKTLATNPTWWKEINLFLQKSKENHLNWSKKLLNKLKFLQKVEQVANNLYDHITHNIWPPNSPHLNPLDYHVWSIFMKGVREHSHGIKAAIVRVMSDLNKKQLIRAYNRFWPRIEVSHFVAGQRKKDSFERPVDLSASLERPADPSLRWSDQGMSAFSPKWQTLYCLFKSHADIWISSSPKYFLFVYGCYRNLHTFVFFLVICWSYLQTEISATPCIGNKLYSLSNGTTFLVLSCDLIESATFIIAS